DDAVGAIAVDVEILAHGEHGSRLVHERSDAALATRRDVAVGVEAIAHLDSVLGIGTGEHAARRERIAPAHQITLRDRALGAIDAAGTAVANVEAVHATRIAE